MSAPKKKPSALIRATGWIQRAGGEPESAAMTAQARRRVAVGFGADQQAVIHIIVGTEPKAGEHPVTDCSEHAISLSIAQARAFARQIGAEADHAERFMAKIRREEPPPSSPKRRKKREPNS